MKDSALEIMMVALLISGVLVAWAYSESLFDLMDFVIGVVIGG